MGACPVGRMSAPNPVSLNHQYFCLFGMTYHHDNMLPFDSKETPTENNNEQIFRSSPLPPRVGLGILPCEPIYYFVNSFCCTRWVDAVADTPSYT
jgi:hypothetical protein